MKDCDKKAGWDEADIWKRCGLGSILDVKPMDLDLNLDSDLILR